MPPRDTALRIGDILSAIDKIQRYTADVNEDSFALDEKTLDAVLRNLSVIGEAASHLSDDYVTAHPEIPWSEMRGMRNIIIHEYFGVSIAIVWQTVSVDLPTLVAPLTALKSD